MSRKVDGWEDRLQQHVTTHATMSFAWGTNDCCLATSDAVLAMTNYDPAFDVRGSYTDAAGALQALERVGGIIAAGDRMGSRIRPLLATLGDVGLVEDATQTHALALCIGEHFVIPGPNGFTFHALASARMAWRV